MSTNSHLSISRLLGSGFGLVEKLTCRCKVTYSQYKVCWGAFK